MIHIWRDLLWSFQESGLRRVTIINGHGGNRNTMEAMLSEVGNEFLDIEVKFRCCIIKSAPLPKRDNKYAAVLQH